eukprot:340718-Prymnesium_polylepis.1
MAVPQTGALSRWAHAIGGPWTQSEVEVQPMALSALWVLVGGPTVGGGSRVSNASSFSCSCARGGLATPTVSRRPTAAWPQFACQCGIAAARPAA